MKNRFFMVRKLTALAVAALASHAASAATFNVTFGFPFFSPNNLTINVGDTVVWTGQAGHTVTGTNAETLCGSSFVTTCTHTFMNPGTFGYECIVPGHAAAGMMGRVVVNPAPSNAPPVVSITSPANGAVFAAPANVTITANATDSDGSVTNVQLLANATPMSETNGPGPVFRLTASALAAGSYALTAKATDNGGASTTSGTVNISVVAPVAVSNSPPRVANGQFSFNYTADPGLRYVVQNSSNLVNWVPIATNTAAGSNVSVTDSFDVGGLRFYRVGRVPNP
ncbi:MAG TPA: Ig-like domain-containing protein [Verrucomicrobiae bacterium]|nr:Ig-like domain-containing protein [Verrucomicrobiae bacterium]